MLVVDKEVCTRIMNKNLFRPVYCSLCRNSKKRSECSNWKEWVVKEDREIEENSERFDERRELARDGVAMPKEA